MTPAERAEWLAKRKVNVGASEAGALLGVSTRRTRFELWCIKSGLLEEEDLSENQRVFWGTVLEPAIAHGVAVEKGWTIHKVHRYIQHPTVAGMAASLDYEVVNHPKGPGVLEIKNCDAKQWYVDYGKQLPLEYEIQLQHQLAVVPTRAWGAIGLLVGGNDLKVFARERHDGVISRLETEVPVFWQSVVEKKPPAIDWESDADTVIRLSQTVEPASVFRSDDAQLLALLEAYEVARSGESACKETKQALKARLLQAIGNAERAYIGPYKISAGTVSATRVEAHEKAGYRGFRVTKKNDNHGG